MEEQIKPVTVAPVATSQNMLMPIAIIIAGALVAGAVLYSNNNGGSSAGGNEPQKTAAKHVNPMPELPINALGEVGNPNALVTMTFWSDYQCPFCKRYEDDTIVKLMNGDVKAGKVKIIFKDFVFLGPDSQTAAIASRAVREVAPQKFLEWNNAMFFMQDAENGGWGKKEDIIAFTKTIKGIDANKVSALMDSKLTEYEAAIEADKQDGIKAGVQGTPSALIAGKLIVGAQPYATIKEAIDAALNPAATPPVAGQKAVVPAQ